MKASSALHSALDVGLDMGNMIGRSFKSAIVRTTWERRKKEEEGGRRRKKEVEGIRRNKKEKEGRMRKKEEGGGRKKKEERGRRRKEVAYTTCVLELYTRCVVYIVTRHTQTVTHLWYTHYNTLFVPLL